MAKQKLEEVKKRAGEFASGAKDKLMKSRIAERIPKRVREVLGGSM